MANWVENELSVVGPRRDREAFLSAAAGVTAGGTELPLSFAALLPMPEGETDPNRWAWDHWGTKAEVWEWIGLQHKPRSIVATFATAWSSPTTLLETVSRRYPALTFYVRYQDLDGGFSGSATIKNGDVQLVEM